jgi:hypothetical protein
MTDALATDFAWLGEAPGQRYLAARVIGYFPEFHWTLDPNKALRFYSEKQCADTMAVVRRLEPSLWDFARTLGEAWPRQHGWIGKAQGQPPPDVAELVAEAREEARACARTGLPDTADLLDRLASALEASSDRKEVMQHSTAQQPKRRDNGQPSVDVAAEGEASSVRLEQPDPTPGQPDTTPQGGPALTESPSHPIRWRSATRKSTDWVKAADSETVWRVCQAIKGECEHCPNSETVGEHEDCTRGCYLQAVECVNIVQTGNPWRKTEGVKPPWTVFAPSDDYIRRVTDRFLRFYVHTDPPERVMMTLREAMTEVKP